MFKGIRLNNDVDSGGSLNLRLSICNNNNNNNINNINISTESGCSAFGKYQKTPDADSYPVNDHLVFVAPELTDASKVKLLHFPNGAVRINSNIDFILKRNGVKGNFEVKVEDPSGSTSKIPLESIDPERFKINFNVNETGLYKIHIFINSVALPKSPLIIICI